MTADEIKTQRNELLTELRASIKSVRRTWKVYCWVYLFIRIPTLVLAALVACEPLLKSHAPEGFWDSCAVLVLLLLLFDLGLRPAEAKRGHLNFISDAEVLTQRVSLVDLDHPQALRRLDDLNDQRQILMEKHRAETS